MLKILEDILIGILKGIGFSVVIIYGTVMIVVLFVILAQVLIAFSINLF